jgi:hypothetical protein
MILFLLTTLLTLKVEPDSANPSCGLNGNSQTLAALIIQHKSQKRPTLECNELLANIADKRAKSLLSDSSQAKEISANQFVIKNGFRFASYYPVTGNQVEAVTKTVTQPDKALDYLIQSNKHHDHVLGSGDFFARQNQIGVGFHQNEWGQSQYVVLIAEPYQSPKIVYKQEFNAPKLLTETQCPRNWRNSPNQQIKKVCREMHNRAQEDKAEN